MRKRLPSNIANVCDLKKVFYIGCTLGLLIALAYSIGDTTSSGGTVTALTDSTVTVQYYISAGTYIDSSAPTVSLNDQGYKNVVNGTSHYGGSVTRSLVAMPSIDSLDGYTTSSIVLDLYCSQYGYRTTTTYTDYHMSLRAYALTQSWTEAATWNTTDGTTSWTTLGGTYDATTYVNATAEPVLGGWTTLDLTSIWSECSPYGVELENYLISSGIAEDQSTLDPSTGYVTLKYRDETYSVASQHPYVLVTYTVPEPATIALLLSGFVGAVVIRHQRNKKVAFS
jgi:hypothetical protein